MPTYKLQHGQATGSHKAQCGSITISQANNQTTVMANPPGGGQPVDITSLVVFTKGQGSNGTLFDPSPGDMINLGTYQVTVTFPFGTDATYRAAGNGPAGFFTAGASPTGAADDWDAAVPGTPEPKGKS
ncbi:MAG TPA: hypothetical protein VGQ37_17725 [Vicinamibacterales bacterium]|jgi:hypothetical protein|nr:hypothetical protein [Vicinamibacterales bacterium]